MPGVEWAIRKDSSGEAGAAGGQRPLTMSRGGMTANR